MDVITTFISGVFVLLASFLGSFGTVQSFVAPPLPVRPPPAALVLFGGDIMLDRSVRTAIDEKGGDFIFTCIDPILRSADVVVANLEGPVTASSSKSVGSVVGGKGNYTFTFAPASADLLYRHGIRIVSIGNNHIMNFGLEGLNETKANLSKAGVGYFGDPDSNESDKVLRTEIRGVRFSFVNWSDWTSDKTDHTVAQVRAEAQSGRVVVVYAHWGEEYIPAVPRVKELAHEFVDAGAAIVIGSHPHVVQEHELYHGRHIYYSLGNFIFDQYWNEAVRTGLLVHVQFDTNGVRSVREIPIHLERDRTTCPLTEGS